MIKRYFSIPKYWFTDHWYSLVRISHSMIFSRSKNCTKRGPPVLYLDLQILTNSSMNFPLIKSRLTNFSGVNYETLRVYSKWKFNIFFSQWCSVVCSSLVSLTMVYFFYGVVKAFVYLQLFAMLLKGVHSSWFLRERNQLETVSLILYKNWFEFNLCKK